MLSFITDLKNFAVGAVAGGLNRAASWGSWAMGFNSSFGGLIIPSLLLLPAGGAGIGLYLGGTALAIGAGLVTGFVQGGFTEMAAGMANRREWEQQKAQERDQHRLQELQTKMERTREKMGKLQEKAQKVQGRMQERAENHQKRGGFVEREQQRRAAAAQGRGRR